MILHVRVNEMSNLQPRLGQDEGPVAPLPSGGVAGSTSAASAASRASYEISDGVGDGVPASAPAVDRAVLVLAA